MMRVQAFLVAVDTATMYVRRCDASTAVRFHALVHQDSNGTLQVRVLFDFVWMVLFLVLVW